MMDTNDTDIIQKIISEDNKLITYRKSLRKIAKSVTGAILLQQMMFRSEGHDKFYKFKSPCSHKLYKPGDSWIEELGFSEKEFDSALKKIGTKITKGISKADALSKTDKTGIVIYWTDANRVTWYQLNRDLLGKLLKGVYLVDDQREFTQKQTKGSLPLVSETTTETTTETTNSPNGENGTSNKQPIPQPTTTPEPTTNTSHTLTEKQTDELLIFGKHPDSNTPNPSFDTIQEIQNAGWQIRNHIVEQAIAYYIEAVRVHHPGFTAPNNKGVRGDWYKDVNGHLQDYRDLPELYRMAIEKHAENKWKFTRPGSLTNTLTDVALETGAGDGVVAWL
ncbi:MAG: hypothetical protein ACYSQZ_09615 [Planctomycetota bacterium]|jgi:hypothetical protein